MAQSTSSNVCSVTCRKFLTITYEGEMKKTYRGDTEYAAFLGIPYARIPKGLKRNQAPEPVNFIQIKKLCKPNPNLFVLVYKADVTGKFCTLLENPDKGSVDCLYLNIFLPRFLTSASTKPLLYAAFQCLVQLTSGKRPELIVDPLPVLVFIHGGGFITGSNDPDQYAPDLIVKHEVIFVTINYRLGLYGFMNAQSKKCPGNAGLKDQVCALQWIRDHIEFFRGDPNNVTISGNSAGATCVNMHLISPVSKDLFHKAIVQSGGVYAPWGYRGHQRKQSKMLLDDKEFRWLFYSPQECPLLELRANVLLHADRMLRHPRSYSPLFGPTSEKEKSGAFLTGYIEEMMIKVDHEKPVMAGITKEEGISLFCVEGLEAFTSYISNDHLFRRILMDNLRWTGETAERHADAIKRKYFLNWSNMSKTKQERAYASFVRDIYFRRFYDYFEFGAPGAVHKNLYVYRFDHCSEISAVKRHNFENFNDATHGDELIYLYCPTNISQELGKYIYDGPHQNQSIQKVMNHMCSLWANFCRDGVPKSDYDPNNVKWRPHTKDKPCFLSISENLTLVNEPLFKKEWGWLNSRVNIESAIDSSNDTSPEDE